MNLTAATTGLPMPRDVAEQALCAQIEPETFFPRKGSDAGAKAAKIICAECPALQACQEWAIADTTLTHGVFGGLSPKQRIRARRGAPTVPTCETCGQTFGSHQALAGHVGIHRPYCRNGHDVSELGRGKDGRCVACRHESQRRSDARKARASAA